MKQKWKVVLFTLLLSTIATSWAYAQGKFDQPVAAPMVILFALTALALAPILLMMTTSFVKIAVVLAIVRNAIGTQQIPPNQIITGLAMVLTFYIMAPVGLDIYKNMGDVINQKSNQGFFSEASLGVMMQAVDKGKEPFRNFLIKHSHEKERTMFYGMAMQLHKPENRAFLSDKDFGILLPSFVISELSEAFFIGFVIFLPFLVIDMVVANILLSLGMFQLSPITVSLPFKLLMFVLVNGWHLIVKGLIQGYI